jgi:hypothetical protein
MEARKIKKVLVAHVPMQQFKFSRVAKNGKKIWGKKMGG